MKMGQRTQAEVLSLNKVDTVNEWEEGEHWGEWEEKWGWVDQGNLEMD